jgi:GAF domain-containing protein
MSAERRALILARLEGRGGGQLRAAHLCDVCREFADVSGAGVMLMSGDAPWGSVCATDRRSELIEEVQYALGEGPCVDAFHQDRPVLEPDLADPAAARWVAFAAPVVAAGVRAVFGFPLRVGGARLGALNLYRDRPGPLTDDQHADALVLAEVAAAWVLALQAGAPPGELAAELDAGANPPLVVHQATGMVAVQLGVSVAQALVRLRAYAFGAGRPLPEVAAEVVARRLRLDPEPPS